MCTARAYCCDAASLLPPMPSLGVSSLDLGRLWQRRRPLFLVYLPLSLFAADLSFDCGCLLASRVAGKTWCAQGSESGLTREVAEPCERVPSGLLSPQTKPNVTVAPVACTWSASSRITRSLPGALLSGSETSRTCIPAWTQNRPAPSARKTIRSIRGHAGRRVP